MNTTWATGIGNGEDGRVEAGKGEGEGGEGNDIQAIRQEIGTAVVVDIVAVVKPLAPNEDMKIFHYDLDCALLYLTTASRVGGSKSKRYSQCEALHFVTQIHDCAHYFDNIYDPWATGPLADHASSPRDHPPGTVGIINTIPATAENPVSRIAMHRVVVMIARQPAEENPASYPAD